MLDTKRPCPAPGYQLEILDDEIILFNPTSSTIIHGNRSTALIWLLCDEKRTVADIAQLLCTAYPEVASDIQADLHQTLLAFADQGAIQWR